MGHAHGFDWTAPGRIQRAIELRADRTPQKKPWHKIAAILSKEFGASLGEGQVRGAVEHHYRRTGKRPGSRPPELPADAEEPLELGGEDILDVQVMEPPSPLLPVEDLIRQRLDRRRQRKKHEDARRLINVAMPERAPVGILVHGDPHIDDEGTDLELLLRNAELVAKTPGLYAASVGDQQNNWVGRLARLYAEQSTTAREAWALTEKWISMHGRKWLFIVLGNHDLWTGPNDPMQWIARCQGVPLLQEWDVRLALRFPDGPEIRIRCAHDFPGSSMWNPAHAVSKELRLGRRDHVALCGHRHHFGYQPVIDPETRGLLHACRVGSYKEFDEHARKLGLDGAGFPCVLLTIDPRQPESSPDRIKWFLDPEVGAGYLNFLRSSQLPRAA